MLPALIGAGTSLLSGLFGSKSQKQETVNRVDYARMVRDAEAAGFNPLTALRNGGAAGFSVSTTPAAPLSARVADGIASGVNTFLANFDPLADDKREAEFQLVQAQIRNLNAQSSALSQSQSFNVPGYGADVIERRPSGSAGQLSRGTGQGPNGEVLPLYVDWYDPRTKATFQLPNADLPELDQMLVPPVGIFEDHTIGTGTRWLRRGYEAGREYISRNTKVRPLTEDEKKERDESWWLSWLPSVSVNLSDRQ